MNRIIGSSIIVFIVIGLIVFGGVYTQRYLDRTADQLAAQVEKIIEAAEQEKWQESREAYLRFSENWDNVRKNWAMFIDHLEIDNIEMKLTRGRSYIEAKDATNAGAEFADAIMLLEHIPERERLTLYNIF